MERELNRIRQLAGLRFDIDVDGVRELIKLIGSVFRQRLLQVGHDGRQITRLTTKFRDAGRRSPPWKATSQRVPGRPQDGANGNRINRWLLSPDHKFHADEITATLVEIKYYLIALSMNDAPDFPPDTIQNCFYDWLIEHPVEPNTYLDPIQLIPISLPEVIGNARIIQSGHLIPLNRNGRHEPGNSFLMLARSNQLQGDNTVDELVDIMETIVRRHKQP